MLANFFDIRKKARIFLPDFKSNLVQIDERMYAKEFEDSYDKILCYGIAFFKKRCLVYLKDWISKRYNVRPLQKEYSATSDFSEVT